MIFLTFHVANVPKIHTRIYLNTKYLQIENYQPLNQDYYLCYVFIVFQLVLNISLSNFVVAAQKPQK